MARTRIEDLPKDVKISRAELRAIMGGGGTVDTCQTPSGAPIPLPYTNISTGTSNSDSDPLTGKDNISNSAGDESGTVGGMVSTTTTGTGTGRPLTLSGFRVSL